MAARRFRGEDSNPYTRHQKPLSCQLNDPGWPCPRLSALRDGVGGRVISGQLRWGPADAAKGPAILQMSDVVRRRDHRVRAVSAFLAEHRLRLFPDEMFAHLFGSGRGRPSVPADVIATVMVLQSLEGLSDREAVQAVRPDLRWKVAAGPALDDEGFHATVLTLWRNKLRASDRRERIFDAVRDVVAATGCCRPLPAGRWTRRCWTTRSPPRTRSRSWSR